MLKGVLRGDRINVLQLATTRQDVPVKLHTPIEFFTPEITESTSTIKL